MTPTAGPTIGLDLGSAHCGIVAAIHGRPLVAHTVDVSPDDVTAAWRAIEAAIVESCAVRVVIEWAPFYVPRGASLQAATSMARHREVQVRLLDRVEQLCIARSVTLVRIAAATWRKRLWVVKPEAVAIEEARIKEARAMGACLWALAWWASGVRPERPTLMAYPSRSWVDRAVCEALIARLGVEAAVLRTVHERDAMGAILGDVLAPSVREKAPKPREPMTKGGAEGAPRAPRPPRASKAKAEKPALRDRPVAPHERPCGCPWVGASRAGCRADHHAQTVEWLGTEAERNRWRLRERKARALAAFGG